MELGKKIRKARLEAGLSQKQLCGDKITRNMLSLIENGSAHPSMDTLIFLAEGLKKPVSFFLGEKPESSPNQLCMEKARTAPPEALAEIFRDYQSPDPIYDSEKFYLEALGCLALGEKALREGRTVLAENQLEQAGKTGALTPYYNKELERRRLLLMGQLPGADHEALVQALPSLDEELLLRAGAALSQGHAQRALALLEAVEVPSLRQLYLLGEVFFSLKNYEKALGYYEQCGPQYSPELLPRLEICCRELGDFQKAYYWACRQKSAQYLHYAGKM